MLNIKIKENIFGAAKRKAFVPEKMVTNIAFKSEELFEIVAPNVPENTTNRSIDYIGTLNAMHDCTLTVRGNGIIVIHATEYIQEIITIGRNRHVLAVLEIRNNRININNEYIFGSFDFAPIEHEQRFEHAALLLPPTMRTPMIRSTFLHFEIRSRAVTAHMQMSIDGTFSLR